MENGILTFTKDFFPIKGLIEGKDFEIVSFIVLDEKFNFHSVDQFFSTDSHTIFQNGNFSTKYVSSYFKHHPKTEKIMSLSKTTYPDGNYRDIYFYKMRGPIHFDHAISVGFGVVKMFTGEHQGEYLLYNFNSCIEDKSDIELDVLEEMLMLKIYVQLTYQDECDDKSLEKLLVDKKEHLMSLIPGEPKRILKKLESIFKSKKGKVIPFIRG
jgi:hypothetical protein